LARCCARKIVDTSGTELAQHQKTVQPHRLGPAANISAQQEDIGCGVLQGFGIAIGTDRYRIAGLPGRIAAARATCERCTHHNT
jgi:hypothetical protein